VIYIISASRKMMVCQCYDGSHVLDTDTDFLIELAGRLGFDSCNISGGIHEAFPDEESHPPKMPRYFKCVPSVYIESKDIVSSEWWGVPFVNDQVFNRYLHPVKNYPGLLVPATYVKYLDSPDTGTVGMELNHPCGVLNGTAICTFPAFLPMPQIFDGVALSYTDGLMCLTPLEDIPDLSKKIKDIGLERFIMPTSDLDNFGDEIISYQLDDKRSVVFYLPNMDFGGEGTYFVHGMAGRKDNYGIGVDTVKGKILTC